MFLGKHCHSFRVYQALHKLARVGLSEQVVLPVLDLAACSAFSNTMLRSAHSLVIERMAPGPKTGTSMVTLPARSKFKISRVISPFLSGF